jgi:hypothetical protein
MGRHISHLIGEVASIHVDYLAIYQVRSPINNPHRCF